MASSKACSVWIPGIRQPLWDFELTGDGGGDERLAVFDEQVEPRGDGLTGFAGLVHSKIQY